MSPKNRYKGKLIVVPLLIAGFIYLGITMSTLESQAENIRFRGTQYFIILAILPPAILIWYMQAMIKERRSMIKGDKK